MSKKTSRSKKIIWSIIAVLLLTAGLYFSVVEFKPITTVSPETEHRDGLSLLVNSIKISSAMRKAAKDANTTTFKINIPQDSLNSLLNMATRTWEASKKPQDPLFYAQADNGIMTVKFSQKTFAGYLNAQIACAPVIKDQSLQISIKQSKLGKLPLPNMAVQKAVDQALEKYSADQRYKLVMQAVVSAEFQTDGSLTIVFDKVHAALAMMTLLNS
ncbi:MAG: hypothetical protein E7052_05490 [Lentisphaerae bacterium]|nr:hypothetical protein [Lentisphaerota bacterium]